MDHSKQLVAEGFLRVERDDRLFDVLPHLTREHGVELWEKWPARRSLGEGGTPDTVELILIHFQNPRSKPEHLSLPRPKLEASLLKNQKLPIS